MHKITCHVGFNQRSYMDVEIEVSDLNEETVSAALKEAVACDDGLTIIDAHHATEDYSLGEEIEHLAQIDIPDDWHTDAIYNTAIARAMVAALEAFNFEPMGASMQKAMSYRIERLKGFIARKELDQ